MIRKEKEEYSSQLHQKQLGTNARLWSLCMLDVGDPDVGTAGTK